MKAGPTHCRGDILREENGMVLFIILFLMVMLTFLGLSGLMTATTDIQISKNYHSSTQALNLAEAGLEQAMADLIADLGDDQDISNSNFYRTDGSTLTITASSTAFYDVFSSSLGNGTYTVAFKNVGTSPNFSAGEIFVRSTGLINDNSQKVIESYLATENVNPWNNAIFANGGGGTIPLNGNVNVGGSVHILGNGLNACDGSPSTDDTAVYVQTGNIFNGHDNGGGNTIDNTLDNYINYTGWNSNNLNAKLRVKKGCVDMQVGSGEVGISSNAVKGIYVGNGDDSDSNGVNDDIVGGDNEGAGQNLYSRNRTTEGYDLGGVNVPFPTIDTTWLNANSLDMNTCGFGTDDLQLTSATNDFGPCQNVTNGRTNSIQWDKASKTLTISGIIKMDKIDIEADINYSGKGTLYSTNTGTTPSEAVQLEGNILPATTGSYPTTHVIGIIATGDIAFDKAGLIATGAFYSAQTITPKKQTEVAGTLVCNKFDLGSQVPKVWQVITLASNLPPGMPGSNYIWVFTTRRWREVF
ncbi:MAG: hypothetical protein HYY20_10500 [Candidatus Tectomicrobia bacterium]|uniref:Type 4 fimbrial biogenesis protein PilX N-terminal domain-containing protein n=1 Tax=Tectimicrobiota bacterium TaxID=2528274 RepID=A0A932CPT4_UNCTE|nr:hypothetical protein [Candidatus Tectomicrobia bacterium]